jgi:hypothetical protein
MFMKASIRVHINKKLSLKSTLFTHFGLCADPTQELLQNPQSAHGDLTKTSARFLLQDEARFCLLTNSSPHSKIFLLKNTYLIFSGFTTLSFAGSVMKKAPELYVPWSLGSRAVLLPGVGLPSCSCTLSGKKDTDTVLKTSSSRKFSTSLIYP